MIVRITQGILSALLSGLLLVGLSACSSDETTTQSEPPQVEPTNAVLVISRGDWHHFVDVALDGSEVTTLTPRFAGLAQPALSPDGSKILYALDPSVNSTIKTPSLHVFDIASTADTTLVAGSITGSCSWTPDGDAVAWLYNERPLGEPPGPYLNRRLLRFGVSEDTSVTLTSLADSDDVYDEVPAALSVIAADDEWLYLFEGQREWRGAPAIVSATGLWRVPVEGGALERIVRFTEFDPPTYRQTFEPAATLEGEDLFESPCVLGTPGLLDPDDTLEVELRYRTSCGAWHGSHVATITFPVRTYRIRDGAVMAEESRVQTFYPIMGNSPPAEEFAVATVRDPYHDGRWLESRTRYAAVSNLALYEVTSEGESLIASATPAGPFETLAYPLSYLPSGDFLYVLSAENGESLNRYSRDTGSAMPVWELVPAGAEPWQVELLGTY